MDRRTFLTSTVVGSVTGTLAGTTVDATRAPTSPGATHLVARFETSASGLPHDRGPLADAAFRFTQTLAERTEGALVVTVQMGPAVGAHANADIVFATGDRGMEAAPVLSLLGAAPTAVPSTVRAVADRLAASDRLRGIWAERATGHPLAIGLLGGGEDMFAHLGDGPKDAPVRGFGLAARAFETIGRGRVAPAAVTHAVAGICESAAIQVLPLAGDVACRPLGIRTTGPVLAAFVAPDVWAGLGPLARAAFDACAAIELARSATEQQHIAEHVLPRLSASDRWRVRPGAAPAWRARYAEALADLAADLARSDRDAAALSAVLTGGGTGARSADAIA